MKNQMAVIENLLSKNDGSESAASEMENNEKPYADPISSKFVMAHPAEISAPD